MKKKMINRRAKRKGSLPMHVTELWGLWHKGRSTGAYMESRGLHMSDVDMGTGNDYAETEMHKDITAFVPSEEYRKAVTDAGFSVPEFV